MAEKSLFFNAFEDETSPTGYDRNYNADDISDWQSAFLETGVIKTDIDNGTPQGLKVVTAGGMSVSVATGKAAIKGKGYINTTAKTLTAETAGSSARYDMIVLRYNNVQSTAATSRKITAEYKKGIGSIPTVNDLQRDDNVYELLLAYVYVGANATTLGAITDTRGDSELCPWFTPVKGYEDYYDAIIQTHESVVTMGSAGLTVTTDLPSKLYNSKYSLIEVYTNGIKEPTSAYTVSLSGGYIVITFNGQKSAGAQITVKLDNFLDGEGMSTALEQYTQFIQAVAELQTVNEYNYICNGVNDNVVITNYVNTKLAEVNYNGAIVLNIIGNLGVTAPVSGDGSTANPYVWFDFNVDASRKVILDFTRARNFTPNTTNGKRYYLFKSVVDLVVKRLNVVVYNNNVGTSVQVFEVKNVTAEYCNFFINAYQDSYISEKGTFINCEGYIANTINNSFCFNNRAKLRIDGGSYRAYCSTGHKSAVVGQLLSGTLCIIFGIDAPSMSVSGLLQTHAIYATTGHIDCTALNSELTVVKGFGEVRNTITQVQAP